MKVYSKTGDDGTTGLYGGDRTSKSSARIQAIGDVDELNAIVGVVRLHSIGDPLDATLSKIQNWLFDLGAELACPPSGKFQVASLREGHSKFLEDSIDSQTAVLPELKAFILPGGSALAAHLHLARCVCRRAERSVTHLNELEPLSRELKVFLNRLSDWLFVAARTANMLRDVQDIEWTQSEAL